MVPWPPVLEELRPWLSAHQHPASRLAEATGVPQGTCARLLKGTRDTITADLARRLLTVVDVEMAEAA
jgi:plasmid maintenance system antidote protein VapI